MALLSSLTTVGKPSSSQARHGGGKGAPDADAWHEQLLLAFQLLLQTVGEPARAPLLSTAQPVSCLYTWPALYQNLCSLSLPVTHWIGNHSDSIPAFTRCNGRCAGQAPRSPVLAQHVVLPVLHILLDAMGADATQSKERSQRSRSAGTPASSQPATSPGSASSAADGRRSLTPPPDAGAALSGSVPQDEVSSTQSEQRDRATAEQQTSQRQQVLVSFSDFMSGRAGLADYLARRATSAASESRLADGGDDSSAQQLMLKCVL